MVTPANAPAVQPNVKPSINTGTGTSDFAKTVSTSGASAGLGVFQYQPKETNINDITQTSQPDIASLINSTMQQLVGRNATSQEIQQYGAELLAAERANQGRYHQELVYDPSTSKPLSATGYQLTTGIDVSAFLSNLIQGTADAKSYRAATQYFDGMVQALQEMKAI